ncbi:MAG: helix-turn-helix domain-containing protein [Sphingobacteriaceae bacterium]|nr:helix-turn-helix domain-containing protein [Sphingobacteriaceae bacterium]
MVLNTPFYIKALERILNNNQPKISIADLAESLGVSRITLHKQFLLHIGTNPSQFIKIERFRNAIKLFTKQATKEQLIDIAYLAEYFDQSHMVKILNR